MGWTISKIAKYSSGNILNDDNTPLNINGFSIDSRLVDNGDVFVALKGERTDGHYYIKEAFKNGASACMVIKGNYHVKDLEPGEVLIEVSDTYKALKQIALKHREQYNVKVIGITGSVGKTTTKEMIATVLESEYKVLKTEGNLNTDIGLPLVLLQLDESHEVVVLEMAMRQIGDISELCRIAKPEIGIITNIAESHLENLKTIDNIAKAKGELLEGLSDKGVAVINGDDERVLELKKRAPGKVLKFGLQGDVDLKAKALETGSGYVKCIVEYDNKENFIEEMLILNFPGRHNLTNAMAALLVGIEMRIPLHVGVNNLYNFYPMDMRNQVFTGKGDITIINDTYNANVKSTKAALDILSDIAFNNKIAVLGDMHELGDYTDRAHMEIGEYAANREVDLLFAVGGKADLIKKGALKAGLKDSKIYIFPSKEKLIKSLTGRLNPGDTVLVKGSRGMALEDVVYAIIDEEG